MKSQFHPFPSRYGIVQVKTLIRLLFGLQFILSSGIDKLVARSKEASILFVNAQCEAPVSFSLQLLIKPEFYKLTNEDISEWINSPEFANVFTSLPHVPDPERLFCRSKLLSSVEVEDISSSDIQKAFQKQEYDNAATTAAKTALSAALLSNFVSTFLNDSVLSGFGVILSLLFPNLKMAQVLGDVEEHTVDDVVNQAEKVTLQSLLAQGIITLIAGSNVDDHTIAVAQATSDALLDATPNSSVDTISGGLEGKIITAAAEINEIYHVITKNRESDKNTLCIETCNNPSLHDENTILYCECDRSFLFLSKSRDLQPRNIQIDRKSYNDAEILAIQQSKLLFNSREKSLLLNEEGEVKVSDKERNSKLNLLQEREEKRRLTLQQTLSNEYASADVERLKGFLDIEEEQILRKTSEEWEDDHTLTTTVYYRVDDSIRSLSGVNGTISDTFQEIGNGTTINLPTQVPLRNESTTILPTQAPTRVPINEVPTQTPTGAPANPTSPALMKSYLYTIKITGIVGLHQASLNDITINTDSLLQKASLKAQGIYDESEILLTQEVYETSQ